MQPKIQVERKKCLENFEALRCAKKKNVRMKSLYGEKKTVESGLETGWKA